MNKIVSRALRLWDISSENFWLVNFVFLPASSKQTACSCTSAWRCRWSELGKAIICYSKNAVNSRMVRVNNAKVGKCVWKWRGCGRRRVLLRFGAADVIEAAPEEICGALSVSDDQIFRFLRGFRRCSVHSGNCSSGLWGGGVRTWSSSHSATGKKTQRALITATWGQYLSEIAPFFFVGTFNPSACPPQ